MTKLNRAQREALHRLWQRDSRGMTYREFRKTVQPEFYGPAVMVQWCGMWIGIEPDGYVHS